MKEYEMDGHVARMGQMRNAYEILVRKSEEFIWLSLGTNG